MTKKLLLAALSLAFAASACHAEDFYCEVMSVEGTATLSNASTSGRALAEGGLLSVDDVVSVGAASYVDLAYDRDWNNITRVEENSSIRIRSLHPTEVELEGGGVFAKLKSLPKDSSFDVKTPTAIASVRGTEYRTTYLEGETQVYNVSESDVYVFGVDSAGQTQAEPVVIKNSEKTFIQRRGEAPMAPRPMETPDIQRAAKFQRGIEQRVMQNIDRGRVGKLPDVGAIERRIGERRQQGGRSGMSPHMAQEMRRVEARGGRPGEQKPAQENRPQQAPDERGGGLVSGQGMRERRPEPGGGDRFEGRGIGGPTFPSDENHRTGGPQPRGISDNRWKSADEAGNRGGNEPRPDNRPGEPRKEMGPNEGPQQRGPGQGPGQNQGPGKPEGKQQARSGGQGKPAPKRP